MFGDIPIFGNSENGIDDRGRIFIPKFTGVEKNDKLIIQKGNGNYYVIFNYSDVERKIEQIRTFDNPNKLELYISSIVALVNVDSDNRITFSQHKNFAIDRKVFIHGNYDSIQIFPSQKDFEDHIEELKKSL